MTVMDDLISRQAAITIPVTPKEDREYQTYNLDDAYEQAWQDLQKKIEQLSAAQLGPEHRGRWIEEPGMFMCSMCYDPWSTEDEEMIKGFNYCPNCGARMEEGEEL